MSNMAGDVTLSNAELFHSQKSDNRLDKIYLKLEDGNLQAVAMDGKGWFQKWEMKRHSGQHKLANSVEAAIKVDIQDEKTCCAMKMILKEAHLFNNHKETKLILFRKRIDTGSL